MADQDGEKTQDPTPHRRQQAREQGQVVRSQDLGSAALLLLGLMVLAMLGKPLVDYVEQFSRQQLGGEAWLAADADFIVSQVAGITLALARCVLPILGLLLLAAVAVNLMQVGFLFLPDKLALDITRLDPLKGFGRIFSLSNAVHLLFGLCKVAIVSAVAAACLYNDRDTILGLGELSMPQIAAVMPQILFWTAIKIAFALFVLAVLDYGYQRWKHERDLKMTPQEIREEMKNLEGNPQMIARRKQVQRQLALSRVSSAVPKADVIITNPTELAIAIQYEPATMAAPIVVAKGAGVIAARIRQLALEHNIPIIEKKPLAQALYREVDVNHPIPTDKYAAVAEVLAYVYQLKGKPIPSVRR